MKIRWMFNESKTDGWGDNCEDGDDNDDIKCEVFLK